MSDEDSVNGRSLIKDSLHGVIDNTDEPAQKMKVEDPARRNRFYHP